MYPEFKNKVVLVSGGTSGIGAACALAFAKEKAKVIIVGRDRIKAQSVLKKIREQKGSAEFIKTDISQRDQIKRLFEAILIKYSQLDYAVNSAGIEGIPFTNIIDYPEKIWDQVININLTAMWLCLKYELSLMLKKSTGAIVNISSIAGLQASLTGGAAYTASKHGVIGLTKSAALEYANNSIRVNAVCPGVIDTELTKEILGNKIQDAEKIHPLGRLGESIEVANAVLWLCSDQASFMTGTALRVDGGIMS